MSADLKVFTKNYIADNKIVTDIGMDVGNTLDVDRNWNGRFEFRHCEESNGPKLEDLTNGLTSTLMSFKYCTKFLKDIFTEVNG